METSSLSILGMHEEINLPQLDIFQLKSKTDTGAYNSAIDCCYSEERETPDGQNILVFILLNKNHPQYTGKEHTTSSFKTKKVRSSNGIVTNRYQIKMDVEINGHSFRTTFNLSNRSKMRFPTLLGRKLLGNRFIVDVTKNRNPKRINTTKSV